MPATPEQLYDRFRALDITAIVHTHANVFTVEEAQAHTAHLDGGHCKNLFLRDKKERMWLVTVEDERRVDLKALQQRLGAQKLSFGSAERLMTYLGVAPGSVTPLAVINDPDQRVEVVLSASLLRHALINVHPLRNDATVQIGNTDLVRFIEACGHTPSVIDFDSELD
ncbi:MAG: prolyl-tRNA synthetase associated domain-containing protein [Geminicoccaceae bacterium]